MSRKVYITEDNKATFLCPNCESSKIVDITKYKLPDRAVKVKVKCNKCGHHHTVVLEKRRQYRKETNFPGVYEHLVDGAVTDRGRMIVRDVSRGGLKLQLNVKRSFEMGAMLRVEFHLDDRQRTLIKKNVFVRKVDGAYVGAQFDPTDELEKALGFYLMS